MTRTAAVVLLALGWAGTVQALERPTAAQIERYRADGTLEARLSRARALGNDRVDAQLTLEFQDRIRRLALRNQGLTPAEIDEILPTLPPGVRPGLRSTGTNKIFALLLDFSDYPATVPSGTIDSALFADGVPANTPYESLRNYYRRSSYNQLELAGATLGYYRPAYTRASMAQTSTSRENLIKEALTYFDGLGHDFSQYDNNSDGVIDYFCVLWTGPDNGWANFWWGYYTGWSSSFTLDGKQFSGARYSWQWTNRTGGTTFGPSVVIHETGHALGLPDLYDYDSTVGPDGGVGGLDMMDANRGDHNGFSKMLLDWLTPVVAVNGSSYTLQPSATAQQAMIMWPGYSLASPFTEFFMIQNRSRVSNDAVYPTDGLVIWHIDATLTGAGGFAYNNSYSTHKLVRLMEADGLEQIEAGGSANAGDFYTAGKTFTNATVPSSNAYDTSPTLVGASAISKVGSDFTFTAGDTIPAFATNVTSVSVPEGGTATFQVRLSLAPPGTVDATVSRASGDADLSVQGGASLTFTAATWNTYQTVTLAAAEDADLANGTAVIRVSATGLANKDITATEADNEVGTAVYDSTLKAPSCATPKPGCDSFALLAGRDNMSGGTEPNQPNTLFTSCADGGSGSYGSSESIERIRVTTQDGATLAPGKVVQVDVTVYVVNTTTDRLDLYYTGTAAAPAWTLIGTLTPSAGGFQTLSTTYTLPSGTAQAIRGNFRYLGSASSCSVGSYNDHDDLVFATGTTPVPFTDPTLSQGVTAVRVVHVTELRTRIDALRVRFGLVPFAWTDATLLAGQTSVRAVHIAELRSALQAAYVAAGASPPVFSDPVLTATLTVVKAVHITELRNAVIALE